MKRARRTGLNLIVKIEPGQRLRGIDSIYQRIALTRPASEEMGKRVHKEEDHFLEKWPHPWTAGSHGRPHSVQVKFLED